LNNATSFSKFNANPDEWITASEAARIRGVFPQAIASLMRRGKLRTIVFGQRTFVNRHDVETFVPNPGGRPKKKESARNGESIDNKLTESIQKPIKEDDFSDWISQLEAALIRGCSKQAIFNLVARGKLETLKIGGKTFVRRSQVETYTGTRGGRPRKKEGTKKKRKSRKKAEG
jgi:hypothetical protein